MKLYNLTERPLWVNTVAKENPVEGAPLEDGVARIAAVHGEPFAWSNEKAPPAIGDRVDINFNELGSGVVTGYFVEHGWLGIYVTLDKRPAWHIKQNGDRNYAMVFGIEVEY